MATIYTAVRTKGAFPYVDSECSLQISSQRFVFDRVFCRENNFEIFQHICLPLLLKFYQNYNVTVFCYGQTSSGKTYSIGMCLEQLEKFAEKIGKYENYRNTQKYKEKGLETTKNQNGASKMINTLDVPYNADTNENDFNSSFLRYQGDLQLSNTPQEKSIKAIKTHSSADFINCDYYQNEFARFGLILHTFLHIFSTKSPHDKVYVTFIEIYNENVYDLLSTYKVLLQIQSGNSEENLVGCKEVLVETLDEALSVLKRGLNLRTVKSTKMNEQSSRSHGILTIILHKQENTDNNSLIVDSTANKAPGYVVSKFTFVDLAGSERLNKTFQRGHSIKESISINSGLLALSNVINALSKNQKFIPYRDSKITRILKKSLGGNSYTTMLACISNSESNMNETLNTLKYAQRTKLIQNNAKINTACSKTFLDTQKLFKEINVLKTENQKLKLELKELHKDKNIVKLSENAHMLKKLENENDLLKEKNKTLEIDLVKMKEKVKELETKLKITRSTHKNNFSAKLYAKKIPIKHYTQSPVKTQNIPKRIEDTIKRLSISNKSARTSLSPSFSNLKQESKRNVKKNQKTVSTNTQPIRTNFSQTQTQYENLSDFKLRSSDDTNHSFTRFLEKTDTSLVLPSVVEDSAIKNAYSTQLQVKSVFINNQHQSNNNSTISLSDLDPINTRLSVGTYNTSDVKNQNNGAKVSHDFLFSKASPQKEIIDSTHSDFEFPNLRLSTGPAKKIRKISENNLKNILGTSLPPQENIKGTSFLNSTEPKSHRFFKVYEDNLFKNKAKNSNTRRSSFYETIDNMLYPQKIPVNNENTSFDENCNIEQIAESTKALKDAALSAEHANCGYSIVEVNNKCESEKSLLSIPLNTIKEKENHIKTSIDVLEDSLHPNASNGSEINDLNTNTYEKNSPLANQNAPREHDGQVFSYDYNQETDKVVSQGINQLSNQNTTIKPKNAPLDRVEQKLELFPKLKKILQDELSNNVTKARTREIYSSNASSFTNLLVNASENKKLLDDTNIENEGTYAKNTCNADTEPFQNVLKHKRGSSACDFMPNNHVISHIDIPNEFLDPSASYIVATEHDNGPYPTNHPKISVNNCKDVVSSTQNRKRVTFNFDKNTTKLIIDDHEKLIFNTKTFALIDDIEDCHLANSQHSFKLEDCNGSAVNTNSYYANNFMKDITKDGAIYDRENDSYSEEHGESDSATTLLRRSDPD